MTLLMGAACASTMLGVRHAPLVLLASGDSTEKKAAEVVAVTP